MEYGLVDELSSMVGDEEVGILQEPPLMDIRRDRHVLLAGVGGSFLVLAPPRPMRTLKSIIPSGSQTTLQGGQASDA